MGYKAGMMQKIDSITLSAMFLLLMGLGGCDSLGDAAAQGADASLRSLIDLLLTDLTNQVADSLLPDDSPSADEGDGHEDEGGTDDEHDHESEAVTLVADVQPILNDRCVNCHSPGGFAQTRGIPWDFTADSAFDDLVDRVSSQDAGFTLVVPGEPNSSLMFLKINSEFPPVGGMMPPGGPPLTDEQIQLIRSWVEQGAVKGGEDDTSGGSADDGEILYSASNCSACHCPDASGGCALSAPAVVGATAEHLDAHLRGGESHAGGTFPFDDHEIANLAAYLRSL